MKVSDKGQVTIPPGMRKKHGLLPDAEVAFVNQPDGVLVTRARMQPRGKRVVSTLMRGGVIKGRTRDLLQMTRQKVM